MTIQELYGLYNYLNRVIENYYMDEMTKGNNFDAEPYLVNENMVLNLYHEILHGEATRKDFLISAIKDMIYYMEKNDIQEAKSTLLLKFKRIYGK